MALSDKIESESVGILFREEMICLLFSQLLEARGVKTSILDCVTETTPHSKIVTEPIYFSKLDPDRAHKCLVVGNKNTLTGLDAVCLSRPLTEEKVENAIEKFLSL